jgi:two-component system, NtrC family, sensor histidine kinase GlrK
MPFRVTDKRIRLRPQYPRSFTVLLLIAFTVVTLPLIGGMVNTAYLLDKIARDGRQSTAITVAITRATRQLVDGVDDLQRAAGQYYVMEDPALLPMVADVHRELERSISTLRDMPLDPSEHGALEEFAAAETKLFRQSSARTGEGMARLTALGPRFEALHRMAVSMVALGNRAIDRQIASMADTANEAWRTLILQGLAMVPLSLSIALLFSWLIDRPVRQLAQAIRRLGQNDLGRAQKIEGPGDLVKLGNQLDWLRRRLIDLEEQETRFLRHVSHELKTPLTAMREGVELLVDKVGGELTPKQEEITRIMRDNVRDLQRRIEDLIRYSRVAQQPEPLLSTPFNLENMVASVLRRHSLTIGSKDLRIAVKAKGIQAWGNKEKMATALDNLLSNAIRFSPRGGSIEVAANLAGGRLEILICDQGPGVPEQDRQYIFQPFYQGSLQPSGPVRGSGLGLAIVKEYVEAHAGEVKLVDRPPWGACFQIVVAAPEGRRK